MMAERKGGMKKIIFIGMFLSVAAVACGGDQSSGSGGGSSASGSSSASNSTGSGSGGGPATQPAICKNYINCLSIAAPELVGDALRG
jgi:hypothetical protein